MFPSTVFTCRRAGEGAGRSCPPAQPTMTSARYCSGVHWEKSALGIPFLFVGVSRVILQSAPQHRHEYGLNQNFSGHDSVCGVEYVEARKQRYISRESWYISCC